MGTSLDESPPPVGLRECELISSGSWGIAGKSDRETKIAGRPSATRSGLEVQVPFLRSPRQSY